MIGLILLLIIFFWLLLGRQYSLTAKLIISFAILALCLFYLHSKGATTEQILDMLFSFK
ncbi:MAG: hypothetical protein WC552_05595 [Candidatus Omnitrophota bacterium]